MKIFSTRLLRRNHLFNYIDLIKKMSEIDLKRSLDTDSSPIDKRVKVDDELNVIDKKSKLDLNDYRNFRVKEEEVGINEFVSNNKGFKCDIKQRFSDFIVHEILVNGEISELTNQDDPIEKSDDKEANDESIVDNEVLELIPSEQRDKLLELNENDEATDDDFILIDVEDKNKNQRTKIHKFIAGYSSLESATETIDDRKMIKASKIKDNKKKDNRNSNKAWPANLPPYLHFSFYQENKGTTDALGDLAKKLRMNVKNIGYAGLKDKRAISTQQCSIFKTLPKRLIDFNKKCLNYKHPSFTGNYTFKDVPLFLGDAIGNKFELILRDAEFESEEDVDNAVENIKKNGFINYFGIQRFGHSEYPSYRVGIQLIKKQYKEAVDLILRYREKDIEPPPKSKYTKTFNECLRTCRESNDPKTAYKEFYWKATNEGHLLYGLSLYDTNYLNALTNIPRNNRSFFCHSFQSYVWNLIATYRIRTYGLKLVKGDLVVKKKEQSDLNKVDELKQERLKLNYVREFDDEDVMVVDDSNIDNYSIFDIVLPLVGPKVKNPENSVKNEIKRLLDELGITEEELNSVNNVFFLKGTYRKLLAKPANVKHEIVKYENNAIRLYDSDLDRLNKIKHPVEIAGTKTAIKIEFCLPSSAYATVLIRELTRHNC